MTWLKRICILSALAVLIPLTALSHGRNHSVIRADISESSGTVEISAVLKDLMELSGTSSMEWDALDNKGRTRLVRDSATLLAARFCIIQDQERILEPESVNLQIPDDETPDTLWMNPDQQSVGIQLAYSFCSAPARLTFMQWFDPSDRDLLHHVQLLIRQGGEMVMFPAALGKQSPTSFPFNWQAVPGNIADLVDLDTLICSLDNRPVSSVLRIDAGSIDYSVSIPIGTISPEDRELSEEKLLSQLKRIRRSFNIMIDGTKIREEALSTDYFSGIKPDSAHSNVKEQRAGFVMSLNLDASPGTVSVISEDNNPQLFPVYCAIIENGDSVQFTTLNSHKTQIIWNGSN